MCTRIFTSVVRQINQRFIAEKAVVSYWIYLNPRPVIAYRINLVYYP